MDNLPISHLSFAGRKQSCSCLKDELRADLMRRTQGACVVESLGVEGKTEESFDCRDGVPECNLHGKYQG